MFLISLLLAVGQLPLPKYDPADLIERYRAYRLPEPPMNAKPVLCSDISTVQFIGFQVQGDPKGGIYRGWGWIDKAGQSELTVSEPILNTTRRIDADETMWPTVAILESRGDHALANGVLRHTFLHSVFEISGYTDPWLDLRRIAWGYWRQWAIEHPADRSKMDSWLRSMPRIDGIALGVRELSFLKDLEVTLGSTHARRGPTRYDDLLDQTVTAHGVTFSDLKYGAGSLLGGDDLAQPVVKLWEAGFDAIPTMARHLNDRRITQLGRGDRPSSYPAYYHRVCDVAADVIDVCLYGEGDYYDCEESNPSVVRSPEVSNDAHIAKLRVEFPKLWRAAQREGERSHYLNQLKALDMFEKGALDTVSTDGVRAYPLRVLAAKYPKDLLKFYLRVRYEAESRQIGEAILRSALPNPLKRNAFRQMSRGPAAVRSVARRLMKDD